MDMMQQTIALGKRPHVIDAKEISDAAGTDNGVPESADKPVQMKTDSKDEAPENKVKKTNIPLSEFVYGTLKKVEVEKAVEKEFEMALQDRVMEETKDKKNAVESYVYDMRNKLSDKYQEYIIESEREAFLGKLQEVEDWLYEDGEDETKCVYVAKLEELKKVGDPVEERYKESFQSLISLVTVLTATERQLCLMIPSLSTLSWQRSKRF